MKNKLYYKITKENNNYIIAIITIGILLLFVIITYHDTWFKLIDDAHQSYESTLATVQNIKNYSFEEIDINNINNEYILDKFYRNELYASGYIYDNNSEKQFNLIGMNRENIKRYYNLDYELNDFEIICPRNMVIGFDLTMDNLVRRDQIKQYKKGDSIDLFYYRLNGADNGELAKPNEPIKLLVVDNYKESAANDDISSCVANHSTIRHINYLVMDNRDEIQAVGLSLISEKNINDITEYINSLGYSVELDIGEDNYEDYSSLKMYINLIVIVTTIITIITSIILTIKNVLDNRNNYTILKSLGYSNKELSDIYNNNIKSLIIRLLSSISISIIILIILISLVIYIYPFIFYGISIIIKVYKILLFLLLFILIIAGILWLYKKKIVESRD